MTTARGETWTRHSATPSRTFIMGLDIGQPQDSTAMSVMEWNHAGTGEWKPGRNASGGNNLVQQSKDTYDVRHLERLPLGMSYPAMIAELAPLHCAPNSVRNS